MSGTNNEDIGDEQPNMGQNTRRSLERVESIKNLHSYEGDESAYKEDKDWLPSARGEIQQKPLLQPTVTKRGAKDRYPPVESQPVVDEKMLILAPLDSGTNSRGELAVAQIHENV